MSVSPVLFKSKTLKNGEHPVMLRYTLDRKSKYVSTDFTSHPTLWDDKKKRPRKKHPEYILLDTFIDEIIFKVKKLIQEAKSEGRLFTFDDFEEAVKGKKERLGFIEYAEELIARKEKTGKMGTANTYRDCIRAIKKYGKKKKQLHFQDIDYRYLIKMEEGMREQAISENSMSVYLRALRSIFNQAIKEKLVEQKFYPFKEYRISKLQQPVKKRALKKEHIYQIAELSLKKGSKDWDMRNMFLFSYYCRGMNFRDMAYLTWNQIVEGRMIYTRRKTGVELNIKLLPPALEILDYYREQAIDQFVFPVLSDSHDTPKKQENRLKKVLKQMNRSLKEMSVSIGLDIPITTYFARHTYAMVMKRSGHSTAVIGDSMAHGNPKATQAYLDSFENEELDDANEAIL